MSKLILATVIVLAIGALASSGPVVAAGSGPELLDIWDEGHPGWMIFLEGPKGSRNLIWPCQAEHFQNEGQSVSFEFTDEVGFFGSDEFVYLSLYDEYDKLVSKTKTIIIKLDGTTIVTLSPTDTPSPNLVKTSLYNLNSVARLKGKKLQIITDNAIYEAPAENMPEVVRDLRNCQRERLKRFSGKWTDDNYADFHQ